MNKIQTPSQRQAGQGIQRFVGIGDGSDCPDRNVTGFQKNAAIMNFKIILKKTLASSARWASLALPNENWALGGCDDKLNRV
jgi:hypothetical protein